MAADIKDYFLATTMAQPEYTKVQYKHIPEDIRSRYNPHTKVIANSYIYIRIKKCMYGLKQATILAYENLKRSLLPFGYAFIIGTVGYWKHDTRPATFY